jgi:hypothetical protein
MPGRAECGTRWGAVDGNYELGHAARYRSDAVISEFRDRERDGIVVRFRLHLNRVRCAFRVGEGGAAGPDDHERDYAYIRFLFSIEEISAERFAQIFHHYRQAIMADGKASSDPQAERWEQVPQQEKRRLVSAARLTLLELSTQGSKQEPRGYFAKPGEAEWGC